MMNRFFALLLAASCLTAFGQVTYPYNPDGNADSLIGASDIQDLLSGYGLPFSPSEILVDGQTLTTVLTQLQNSIDSLSGLGGSGGSVLDMPLGTVLPVATESVPEGWMLCDGREISIEEYQGLYDLIGTTYGAGDSAFWAQVFYPATTFNIPDLRGRTIIGANDMGGEQSDVLTIHQASAGQVGGEEMHQLTEVEMPSHSHQVEVEGWDFYYSQGGYDGFAGPQEVPTNNQEETSFEGGDQPHNNMQPYMALNYMMKVKASQDNEPFQMYFSGSVGDEDNHQQLSQHQNIVIVDGNSHAENGCSGCSYHYTLNLPDCQCPVGETTRVLNSLGYTNNSPSLRVSYAGNIIANWHGPSFMDFVWTGSSWMIAE